MSSLDIQELDYSIDISVSDLLNNEPSSKYCKHDLLQDTGIGTLE